MATKLAVFSATNGIALAARTTPRIKRAATA
jgi:hypothetical protein